MTPATATVEFDQLNIGDTLPQRQYECGNVQLMLYNAALWNGHRIHFDEPYAKDVEQYPRQVIAGPPLGDWLPQRVEAWLGDRGRIFSIEYSNRIATYVGEVLTSGGNISDIRSADREIEIDVFIKNENQDIVAPGKVVARFFDA